MKKIILPLLFVASCIIGYNIPPGAQTIHASPPVTLSPIELSSLLKVPKTTETVDVTVNLETQEVSINGNTNIAVNVKTIGEPKPKVITKYRTIVKEREGPPSYPLVSSIRKVTEKPIFQAN